MENHLGDKSKFKGVKKHHNPDFIKKGMIILFIITIASLWGGLYSVGLVDKMVTHKIFIKNDPPGGLPTQKKADVKLVVISDEEPV